jgi:ketosteroid isomerase-like protein
MRLIFLAFSIAPLAMLGVAPSALAATQTDAASEIRNVLKSQQDAWNRGDINAFMNGYWHSDQTVFVSGDEVSRGWQKVLDRYKTK